MSYKLTFFLIVNRVQKYQKYSFGQDGDSLAVAQSA